MMQGIRIQKLNSYNRIISPDNAHIKKFVKLANDSQFRKNENLAVIYGEHLFIEAIKYGLIHQVFIFEDKIHEYSHILSNVSSDKICLVSLTVLKKMNTLDLATDIVALINMDLQPNIEKTAFNQDCLVLERVQDPGNLGVILRAACASGISHVVLSPLCADHYNPKVLRASQGVQFGLQIYSNIDLIQFLTSYQGQILAMVPSADNSLYDENLIVTTAFVLGNEGNGLSSGLLKQIKKHVKIPMLGKAESLNLAMAATIGLFEMSRQRIARE